MVVLSEILSKPARISGLGSVWSLSLIHYPVTTVKWISPQLHWYKTQRRHIKMSYAMCEAWPREPSMTLVTAGSDRSES